MTHSPSRLPLLLLIGVLMTSPNLTGCARIGPAAVEAAALETGIRSATTPTTTLQPVPTNTPVPSLPAETPESIVESVLPPAALDLLELEFPTPQAQVDTDWRPPLYDTPWALGPYDHFFFTRPIAANEINTPVWDYRYGGVFADTDVVHTGIDIPVAIGTAVLATGSGRVVWAGYGLFSGGPNPKDPYGLAVAIRHDFGYQDQRLYTVYAHLSKLSVYNGQAVTSGDQLGLSGDTGKTTGPHLHYEVRVSDNAFHYSRNPELWLTPPQGWGVLAGRVLNSGGGRLLHKEIRVTSMETEQSWSVRTYGPTAVNSDPFYQENVVLSDLPAGRYVIRVEYNGGRFDQEITIYPGQVSFFTFRGKYLFNLNPPPTPHLPGLP